MLVFIGVRFDISNSPRMIVSYESASFGAGMLLIGI
jgi:hypothetical protein